MVRAADGAWQMYSRAEQALGHGHYHAAIRDSRQLLQDLPRTADRRINGLRLETIRILLDASEMWWAMGSAAGSKPEIDVLVREAAEIAERLDDERAAGVASLLRGRYLAVSARLQQAIEAFDEAARLARRSGDDLLLLDALTFLGHHAVGRDIQKGVALLKDARQVAERIAGLHEGPPTNWVLRTTRLNCLLGVAEFDLGHFDVGERLLRRAVEEATSAGLADQQSISTNYLGQLLISAGRFSEAEELLSQVIALLGRCAKGSPYQAYNLALLGKSRVEDGKPEEAEQAIEEAWNLLRSQPHLGIATLVANYLAELLLQPNYSGRDLGRAEALLRESIEECQRSGYQRSEVAALCLLSKVQLELGHVGQAVLLCGEAVRQLEAAGGMMPALRTEEIYHGQYEALRKSGRLAEATRSLKEARRHALAKADSIADPVQRMTFLRRVRLNQAIFGGRFS